MSALRNSYRRVRRAYNAARGRDVWQGKQVRCARICLGNEHARWCVCPDDLVASSVVYSVGVGSDVSFDLELIQRFGLRVHAFDPTPRSIEWVKRQQLPEEFVFHAFGVANFDGSCKFFAPENPEFVSHTMVAKESDFSEAVEVPVHRLASIARMLGHERIDVLKMDIEGAEYGVLEDLLGSGLAVKQVLVEFHHRRAEIGVEKTKRAIRCLNEAGYRIFSVSASGEEYGFRKCERPET
jgi:FkbM family methyltransferase